MNKFEQLRVMARKDGYISEEWKNVFPYGSDSYSEGLVEDMMAGSLSALLDYIENTFPQTMIKISGVMDHVARNGEVGYGIAGYYCNLTDDGEKFVGKAELTYWNAVMSTLLYKLEYDKENEDIYHVAAFYNRLSTTEGRDVSLSNTKLLELWGNCSFRGSFTEFTYGMHGNVNDAFLFMRRNVPNFQTTLNTLGPQKKLQHQVDIENTKGLTHREIKDTLSEAVIVACVGLLAKEEEECNG